MLSGKKILEKIKSGVIKITPFIEENLNPNSYDLTLDKTLLYYTDAVLDVKKVNTVNKIEMDIDKGYMLTPGRIYIANTVEYTESLCHIPMIEGKSSLARLGLSIHATAGFGDIGYKGVWTLELSCIQPIVIYPYMKIAQIYYNHIDGDYEEYKGKYQNSKIALPSQSYREFSTVLDRNRELLFAKSLEEIDVIFDKYAIDSYPKRINILEELLHSEPIKFCDDPNNINYKKRYKDIVTMFLDPEVRIYRGIL